MQRNLDIHYQPGANGLSSQICAAGTSGHNMVDFASTDHYVVINQFTYAGSPYTFTSDNPSYNTTYADAVSQLGYLVIVQNGISLILDTCTSCCALLGYTIESRETSGNTGLSFCPHCNDCATDSPDSSCNLETACKRQAAVLH